MSLTLLWAGWSPTTASAQRRFAVQAAVGSGGTIGGGATEAVASQRSPTFFDLGVSSWLVDDPVWWLGGSIRGELETVVSIGATIRVGLAVDVAPVAIRPYLGAAVFFAPFELVGPELGVDLTVTVVERFAVFMRLYADAFFAGSDVPQNAAVLMFNGALGVEYLF